MFWIQVRLYKKKKAGHGQQVKYTIPVPLHKNVKAIEKKLECIATPFLSSFFFNIVPYVSSEHSGVEKN